MHEIFCISHIQQPSSSRPPVLYYVVTHNVTDTESSFPQRITHDTNITIHRVHLDNLYLIQVTPFNALGRGDSGYCCIRIFSSYFGCAAVRVVFPVRTMIVTAAEDPTQSMHECSCAGT